MKSCFSLRDPNSKVEFMWPTQRLGINTCRIIFVGFFEMIIFHQFIQFFKKNKNRLKKQSSQSSLWPSAICLNFPEDFLTKKNYTAEKHNMETRSKGALFGRVIVSASFRVAISCLFFGVDQVHPQIIGRYLETYQLTKNFMYYRKFFSSVGVKQKTWEQVPSSGAEKKTEEKNKKRWRFFSFRRTFFRKLWLLVKLLLRWSCEVTPFERRGGLRVREMLGCPAGT